MFVQQNPFHGVSHGNHFRFLAGTGRAKFEGGFACDVSRSTRAKVLSAVIDGWGAQQDQRDEENWGGKRLDYNTVMPNDDLFRKYLLTKAPTDANIFQNFLWILHLSLLCLLFFKLFLQILFLFLSFLNNIRGNLTV